MNQKPKKQSKEDQEKIIKLARLDGWTNYKPATTSYSCDDGHQKHPWTMLDPQKKWQCVPPNYLRDLNVVHRLREKLFKTKKMHPVKYKYSLMNVFESEGLSVSENNLLHSTARHQSEAILRIFE